MSLCLFCKNFVFTMGARGYSELTPGSDARIYCSRNHWQMEKEQSEAIFRAKILMANICHDYELTIDTVIHIRRGVKGQKKSYCGLSNDYSPMYTRRELEELKAKGLRLNICLDCSAREKKENGK